MNEETETEESPRPTQTLSRLLERSVPFGVAWREVAAAKPGKTPTAYLSVKMGNNRGAIVSNSSKTADHHPDAILLMNGAAVPAEYRTADQRGVKIGALWKNIDNEGNTYRAGGWTGGSLLVVYANPNRRSETDPDYMLALCSTAPPPGSGDTFDDVIETPADDFSDAPQVKPSTPVAIRRAPRKKAAPAGTPAAGDDPF